MAHESDGFPLSIRELLIGKNPGYRRGNTAHLSPRQIADLAEYVLSV